MASERDESIARRLAGSKRGSDLVRARFDAVLTRKRFCDLVGISVTTLRRWENAGVVEPHIEIVLGSPTKVFQADDVEFGHRLRAEIERRPGELSLREAAALVRGRNPSGTRDE